MIIKKYLAKTQREAIEMAKADLGNSAIVMNVKEIKPKGISKIFVKGKVEVTAALEENVVYDTSKNNIDKPVKPAGNTKPDFMVDNSQEPADVAAIEKKLNSLQQLLESKITDENKQEKDTQVKEEHTEKIQTQEPKAEEARVTNTYSDLILHQLLQSEVDEQYAMEIIAEIEKSLSKDAALDNVLAAMYQKIILKLGHPHPITVPEKGTKFVFFLGSTGVGKTTTIAKIVSQLKIESKAKVALITADTYRIAAVEQLKTYANILGIPLSVVYSAGELEDQLDTLKKFDVCLIDTAGRSHKNKEQMKDIKELLDTITPNERDVYLVLSAGTKYSDLKEVSKTYKEMTDYSLIFTKLDETSYNGVLLNLRLFTDKPLSYVTWGQNVPDDIGIVDAQGIAKNLLGGKS